MSDARDLGERLLLAQKRKGWTQKELAVASGVAPATIRRAIAGVYRPRLGTVEKLAGALDVDLKWLAFGEGDAPAVADEPEDVASYAQTAGSMEQHAGEMLARLRELEVLDGLPVKDRARISKEIKQWEKMIRTWERRRGKR